MWKMWKEDAFTKLLLRGNYVINVVVVVITGQVYQTLPNFWLVFIRVSIYLLSVFRGIY